MLDLAKYRFGVYKLEVQVRLFKKPASTKFVEHVVNISKDKNLQPKYYDSCVPEPKQLEPGPPPPSSQQRPLAPLYHDLPRPPVALPSRQGNNHHHHDLQVPRPPAALPSHQAHTQQEPEGYYYHRPIPTTSRREHGHTPRQPQTRRESF
jgi:hypothetical protein